MKNGTKSTQNIHTLLLLVCSVCLVSSAGATQKAKEVELQELQNGIVLRKFAAYYNIHGSFTGLPAGTTTLSKLVGVSENWIDSVNSTECLRRIPEFKGVQFDCQTDVFSWSTSAPLKLIVEGPGRIRVVSSTKKQKVETELRLD